jgi:hypothetical protein
MFTVPGYTSQTIIRSRKELNAWCFKVQTLSLDFQALNTKRIKIKKSEKNREKIIGVSIVRV